MAIEMLMGLNVTDDQSYQTYREKMTPILKNYDGGFGYDFKISEVLKSETDAPINRVFTIYFPDEARKDAFFSNEEYLKVKEMHFVSAVSDITTIATFERAN